MISFPENVKRIIDIYESHGERGFAVGGCVRDSLMGRVPADWDITTSATPEKTIEIFKSEGIKTIPTGLKHGTISLLIGGEIYECTTHRVDGSYTDSRRPDHVEFTARLEDDLSRRDFTVNAIAASPKGGICDCFGGVDDIKNKIIRCVGQPETRFGEDALRILRALRFATVLDFEIEEGTFAAIKKLSHTLSHISAERKTAELFKILSCEHADRGIRLLFECGVMPFLLPDAREKMTDVCVLRGEPSHRLAALMWQTEARDLSLLRLSNAEKSHIKTLISPIKFSETDESARRLIAAAGELATEAATLQNMPKLAELAARQTELGAPTSLRQLALGGADILALGIPSRQVGEVQRFLLEQVLISPELNEASRLISLVKEKFNA